MSNKFTSRFQHGFTLIEAMIVVALIAILAGIAAPSFLESLAKKRVTTATEALFSDVGFVRSEAIKQNREVTFQFKITSAADWCYGLDDDTSTACDCSTAPTNCTINGVQKTRFITEYPGISMSSPLNTFVVASTSIIFDEFGKRTPIFGSVITIGMQESVYLYSESIQINQVGRIKKN